MKDVLIVGAGIGGLTLALELCRRGIGCRVVESAPDPGAAGVGINLLPHAMRAYSELGLQPALERIAVETKEAAFTPPEGFPYKATYVTVLALRSARASRSPDGALPRELGSFVSAQLEVVPKRR